MAAENKHERALEVYQALCANLDGRGWHYRKDEEKLVIRTTATGEDLPMEVVIHVDEGREVVQVLSLQPFDIPEDKRLDMAVAVSLVNNHLVDGSFDLDIKKGRLVFRMTCCYIDSDLGNDLYTYLIMCSFQTIDEYNDKFLMLVKGQMSMEDFIKEETE